MPRLLNKQLINSKMIETFIKFLLRNLLLFIIIVVGVEAIGSITYRSWFKLSKVFRTKLPPPDVFVIEQICFLGQNYLSGINIGITEQKKLYLSRMPLNFFYIPPLLIGLDAITKIEPCSDSFFNGRCYKFFIGEPNITTLVLTQDLIEKLEEDYGEPIFSNKLRQI